LIAAAALCAFAGCAAAQDFPARPVKILVGFAAGGPTDVIARIVAQDMTAALGQSFVVENRAGANAIIATEAVARAAPDGDMLLLTAGGNLLISPHVRKVNYDPLTDFEPICAVVRVPEIIAVNGTAPFHTLADLLGAARARPGQLTLASLGPASDLQIAFEKLKRAAHVNMIYVPYPGVAPAVNALLGEHVTSIMTSYTSASAHLKAGKLRALAMTTRARIEAMPDIPTVAESGYPDYESEPWFGLFAPSKTPRELISQFTEWFSAAARAPEVGRKLAAQGLYPAVICGADFAALVRRDYDDFGRIVREAKITMQ
jgi:tripartite-type tricarboxylate transporter receptor subunit TctC